MSKMSQMGYGNLENWGVEFFSSLLKKIISHSPLSLQKTMAQKAGMAGNINYRCWDKVTADLVQDVETEEQLEKDGFGW